MGHGELGPVQGLFGPENVDVEGARPPSLATHPPRAGLDGSGELEELVEAVVGLETQGSVQVIGLGWPHGVRLVDRGHGSDTEPTRTRERVDRHLQMTEAIALVAPEPDDDDAWDHRKVRARAAGRSSPFQRSIPPTM